MSDKRRPRVVVIAGPNGSGKSSSARSLLRDTIGIDTFVNADAIAAGLSAFDLQAAALSAGRIMLRELRILASAGKDFAFETTLSGRSMQRLFADLVAAGYDIDLCYLWLATPEMAVERVRRRVVLGGHDVPAADIRRRFARSIENFYWIYRPMASRWRVHNGGEVGMRRHVAEGHGLTVDVVSDAVTWTRIQEQAGEKAMNPGPARRVREAADWGDRIDRAFAAADRDVILRHRQAGVPLILWRGGKVVEVDANTIEIPDVGVAHSNQGNERKVSI